MSDRPPVPGMTSGRGWRPAARLAVPLAALGAVIGGFGYVGAVDPGQPGHYPVCPFLRSTGYLCPGCGGLRSAHALAHGDVVGALEAHALAVVGTAVAAAVWVAWCVRATGGGRAIPAVTGAWTRRFPRVPRPGAARLWTGIGLLFAVFTVVRNLPCGAALRPEIMAP